MGTKNVKIAPFTIKIDGRKTESFISGTIKYSKLHKAYNVTSISPVQNATIGTLIIKFLERDFSIKTEFLEFVSIWGLGGFEVYSPSIGQLFFLQDSKMKMFTQQEYDSLMETIWNECRDSIIEVHAEYTQLLYKALDIDCPWSTKLNPIQRFYLYAINSNTTKWLNSLEYKCINKIIPTQDTTITQLIDLQDKSPNQTLDYWINILKGISFEIVEEYESNNIASIIFLEFKELLYQNATIRKCKNCGRYFIAENRSDTEYCNRIVKTTNDGPKTCKDIGPKKKYMTKFNSNPLKKEFLSRKRTIHARMKATGKKRIDYNAFDEWEVRAKQKLNEYLEKYDSCSTESERNILLEEFVRILRSI